jgi:Mycothiol maleylpyruvate isomerase N-terminal domain
MTNESPDLAFEAFAETLSEFEPSALTACSDWTVHDLVVHMVSGADEILRHLKPALDQAPIPATRSFAEREAAWADIADDDLRNQLLTLVSNVNQHLDDLLIREPAHVMPWSGRQMPTSMFRSHLRNEFALHRWDMIGSDDLSIQLLSDPSLTAHTVRALAGPLVARATPMPDGWSARLRSAEQLDVVIRATNNSGLAMMLEAQNDEAPTLDTEPDIRLLLLWNRFQPTLRNCAAPKGTRQLTELRSVLLGY